MNMRSGVTVLDQFCGAGGSSIGATRGGAEVVVALNHWKLAIETHNTNFPDTYHECTDISACDPRRYPATDILITSPECTNHSLAKGIARRRQQRDLFGEWQPDPAAERSRATMWDVPRFAEFHDYNLIIVENVVEARSWVMWKSWIHAMTVSLDYDYQCVFLNSMHAHPTPQSRDRMYVVFWKRGNTPPDLTITPRAWCIRCERDVESVQSWKRPERPYGRYRQQYVYCCPTCSSVVEPYYYCAANAIDWSLPIERIGDRARPLKDKTIARIEEGLRRFAGREALLFALDQSVVSRNMRALGRDVFPTQTQATTMGVSVPPGFLVDSGGAWESAAHALHDSYPTQTIRRQPGLVLGSPFVLAPGSWGRAQDILASALPTQVTEATPQLIVPWIVEVGHGGPENAGRLKAITDSLPTVHSFGGSGVAFAPFVLSRIHDDDGRPRSIVNPLPTQTSRDDFGVALAPFLAEPHGTSDARSLAEALGCVTAGGNHHALVQTPFTIAYNGEERGAHSITNALGAQPTHDRHALIAPSGQPPRVEDCYFRVLKPHEIQRAMAFGDDYVVLGTSRDKIRQLGNAVTPPVMQLILERCLATLRSEHIA